MNSRLLRVLCLVAVTAVLSGCSKAPTPKNDAAAKTNAPDAKSKTDAVAIKTKEPDQGKPDKGTVQKVDPKPKPGDWPLFGGSLDRNLVNTQAKDIPIEINVKADAQKNVKWMAELGSRAYGGPTIAGGKVFVGTNNENPRNKRDVGQDGKPIDKGIIYCFNEADGKFLWQAVFDKLPAGRVHDWPREGICSSPVVEGNRLWFVNNRCEVVCADTDGFLDDKNDGATDEMYKEKTDADIIWSYDMIKNLKVFPHNLATCSPLIVGDRLFIITSNGVDEGHINLPQVKAPSFICLDKNTGKLLWAKDYPGALIMHGQWSNPAYAEVNGTPQVIFPGGDGWIYSLKPEDGEVIWKFDANPKDSVYVLGGRGTRNDFVSTPVIHDNKLYIGVGQDPEHDEGVGHLYCIDMTKKGDISPTLLEDGEKPDNAPKTAPKTKKNPNSGMVWHYGGVAPPDLDRNFTFGRTLSSCAVHDGLCYVGELAGFVHCLDAKTGKPYWVHEMNAVTWSSPSWIDGKVFFGNDDGLVQVFEHGKEKKLLTEIDVGSRVRATPVAANGTLYIMTENKLFAIAKQ